MPTLDAVREATSTPIDPTYSLELTRVIAAPRARVFDAWTRPEIIRQWFGPNNMSCPLAETNPVDGGDYAIQMRGTRPAAEAQRPNESIDHTTTVRGTYTKVSPYDLLQFTWAGDWCTEETSLVTLRFREVDGGTELRLLHEKFTTASSRDSHNHGWSGSLDKLTALLAH